MSRLTVFLFGRLHCEIDGVGLVDLEAHKAQELLSYLALNHLRLHHRDALSTLFWDDRSEFQAKKGLRQALWLLQSALHNASSGARKEILVVDGDWIGFDPQADIEVDAATLERTYRQLQTVSEADMAWGDAEQIRAATLLYKGDLLEGWYQEWCIHERERFEFMYLCLLDRLLGYCESVGDYEGGVNCGMQILRCDNASESTHRRLMRLHYVAGHRTRALHQYSSCMTALKEELGVDPAKSTQRLYMQICSDQMDETARPLIPAPPSLPTEYPVTPNDTLSELLEISTQIDRLQRQVDHLIALSS